MTDSRSWILFIVNIPDGGLTSFTFMWGNNAAIQGASKQKLVYADLWMSLGYGVEEEGKLSCALLVVLRKGPIHKDRHEKQR